MINRFLNTQETSQAYQIELAGQDYENEALPLFGG